jgi:transposase
MAPTKQLQLRQAILRLSQSGNRSRAIATTLGIDKSTVNYTIAKFKSGKGLNDLPKSGRPRATSERTENIIYQKSMDDVRKNAADIARELASEGVAHVSRCTVSRRLREKGLFGRIGVKKPLISAKNRQDRLNFARIHLFWTPEDWKKCFSQTNQSLISSAVMVECMSAALKVPGMIHAIKHQQSSMVVAAPWCGGAFPHLVLVLWWIFLA